MSVREDPRLPEAKHKTVREVLSKLHIYDLRQSPNRREMTGPCPICRDAGHNPKSGPVDRFNINISTGAYFCRKGCLQGGDVVGLVRDVEGLSFADALTFLVGEIPKEETEEQRKKREERQKKAREDAERDEKRREAEAERYRRAAIDQAREIWGRTTGDTSGLVRAYLAARGISKAMLPEIPACLRFIADHPYRKRIGGEVVTAHRGPAMIAAVLDPPGQVMAVHQTWIDPEPPHGKARIEWKGEAQASKLVRGSKKGGAIRLITPAQYDTLVMGEGIETTLSAAVAWADVLPGAAFWAGVDLGNMAGTMQKPIDPATGKAVRNSGLPDLSDRRAFVPPPWLRRLIFIQDGDSDYAATRAKLLSGLRRAMALSPSLKGQIVMAGEGVDLNDVLTGKGLDHDDTQD